jgi:hypothetical protein
MSALLLALLPLLGVPLHDPAQDGPLTAPEATGGARTTTLAEAQAFLDGLAALPSGGRVVVGTAGSSGEGRPLLLAAVGGEQPTLDAAEARSREGLRILVVANIHGGEVEGKEAVLRLLRETAEGQHGARWADCQVWFLPIYNVDGNERIARTNRVSQNGPDGGVGERANAAGLDLNRDFVKAEAPETRALLEVLRSFDPHLLLDLHTTDGSYHGYHLTYATSLSPNTDPRLDRFARARVLAPAREQLRALHGFRAFDYGNLTRGEPARWATYDHRPRFGTNMLGLRNRVAVLSEAYSYLAFPERIEVTHAFVLGVVDAARASADELLDLTARLDRELEEGRPALFGDQTRLCDPRPHALLLGEVDELSLEGLGVRRVARPVWRREVVGLQDRFVAGRRRVLPAAWILPNPSEADRALLSRHGVRFQELGEVAPGTYRGFRVEAIERAERPFQGHHEVRLAGAWSEVVLPEPSASALLVPARQPLARVAAQLLEPESEDSLFTWNHFDERLAIGELAPVLRVEARPDGSR